MSPDSEPTSPPSEQGPALPDWPTIFRELRAAYAAPVDAFVAGIAQRVQRGELATPDDIGREITLWALRPEIAELAPVVGFMSPLADDIKGAALREDEQNVRRELNALAQLVFRYDLRVRLTRVLPDMALIAVAPPVPRRRQKPRHQKPK